MGILKEKGGILTKDEIMKYVTIVEHLRAENNGIIEIFDRAQACHGIRRKEMLEKIEKLLMRVEKTEDKIDELFYSDSAHSESRSGIHFDPS